MKNINLAFLCALIIAGSLFTSCKKSSGGGNNNPPPPKCRVSKITMTGVVAETYVFEYDENKRFKSIVATGASGFVKRILSYPYPDPIHIENFVNNSPNYISYSNYTIWSDGTLKHIVNIRNQPGETPATESYIHYNGFLSSRTTQYRTTIQTTMYKWDNADNLIYIYGVDVAGQPIGDSSIYTYYLDKTYSDKVDPVSNSMAHLFNFIYVQTYGAPLFYTKNLLKTIGTKRSGVDQTYTYEFDAEGKITNIHTVTHSGNTGDARFEYICD